MDLTLYDAVAYPGHFYEQTHPEWLATVAALYRMEAAPVARCRMLELGCGIGGNLIPIAYQYPDSDFIGIDLSGETIARGRHNVERLGLTNLTLMHRDIMDVGDDFGQFDYIVAHGVYSWVPPQVRARMMAIFKRHLAPRGIVYVSYNAHPYSHMRNLVRDMMLFHTRHMTDMTEKVRQSRAILKFLSDGTPVDTVHGAVMRDQYNRVAKMSDAVLFHDDLNDAATAFLLHEVTEAAGRYGLQYLSDADITRCRLDVYDDATRAMLEKFPDDEMVARDQLQDFLKGRGFRSTLLCHEAITLDRRPGPEFAARFCLSAPTEPTAAQFCLSDESPMDFKTLDGADFAVGMPVLKAAYLHLGQAWPRALAFNELVEQVRVSLGDSMSVGTDDPARLLAQAMSILIENGIVRPALSRPSFTTTVSERPQASPVVRWQASNGARVSNLAHRTVALGDDRLRDFVQLLNGSRTIDDLCAEMTRRFPSSADGENCSGKMRDQIVASLQTVRDLALLIG